MIKRIVLFWMVSVAMCLSLSAQDKALMANYQSELQQLFE